MGIWSKLFGMKEHKDGAERELYTSLNRLLAASKKILKDLPVAEATWPEYECTKVYDLASILRLIERWYSYCHSGAKPYADEKIAKIYYEPTIWENFNFQIFQHASAFRDGTVTAPGLCTLEEKYWQYFNVIRVAENQYRGYVYHSHYYDSDSDLMAGFESVTYWYDDLGRDLSTEEESGTEVRVVYELKCDSRGMSVRHVHSAYREKGNVPLQPKTR